MPSSRPRSPIRVVMNAFLAAAAAAGLSIPEANQQVRREPHNLPTHKQQQQAIGDQHPEHRPRKQGEKAEKPGEVFVVVHVRHAVDKDEQPDERHHHQHDRGQWIQHPAQLYPFRSELHPRKVEEQPLQAASSRWAKATTASTKERLMAAIAMAAANLRWRLLQQRTDTGSQRSGVPVSTTDSERSTPSRP